MIIRPSFFPEMDPKPRLRAVRVAKTGVSRHSGNVGNSCASCPRVGQCTLVLPTMPPNPKAVAVGLAPGDVEEELGACFMGPAGQLLRRALRGAGFDDVADVGYINLTRCRPAGDDFASKEWEKMVTRCWHNVQAALEGYQGPLLILGTEACSKFLSNAKKKGERRVQVTRVRGLWFRQGERWVFAARHPFGALRTGDTTVNQFLADVHRFGGRVLGTERLPPVKFKIYKSVREARSVFSMLAKLATPWAFDVETFDTLECPSRKGVAVDPCHPDFRVRGLAVAWGPGEAAYVDLIGDEQNKVEARATLTPAFSSPAIKRGFNGSFDEESLLVPGWTAQVCNRAEDGMLGMLALDMTHRSGFSLQRGIVDLLGEPYHWEADKTRMRELPLEQVADGCVRDATATWRLCELINHRLLAGSYY